MLPDTFSALGDPTRLAIVERLMREGETSAGAIGEALPISAPAVSRHLKVLTKAGLVLRRVDRQRRMYAANPEAMKTISRWTGSYKAFWEQSIDRLQAAVEKGDDHA
ncbi:MAG: metalloregulator ArsR/SmtB family transcription factor [Pseudomonadota bacterium]